MEASFGFFNTNENIYTIPGMTKIGNNIKARNVRLSLEKLSSSLPQIINILFVFITDKKSIP